MFNEYSDEPFYLDKYDEEITMSDAEIKAILDIKDSTFILKEKNNEKNS